MSYVIIDVREPEEFKLGHLDGAINIPAESLMTEVPELQNTPRDANLLVYCRSGSRSAIAIEIFRKMGFTNILNGINQHIARERFNLK